MNVPRAAEHKERSMWAAALIAAAATLAAGCDAADAPADNRAGTHEPTQSPPPRTATTTTNTQPTPSPRTPRFGSASVNPKPAGAIRLASYNVENLFDDKDDPALSGRQEDREMTKDAAHIEALAATIRAIDADVLALQEVESEEALRWFVDAHLSGMGYAHVASIDAGDERGIEQSVLSRLPIVEARNWPRLPLGGEHPEKWGDQENFNAGQPITFHRSPLMVTVAAPAAGAEGNEAGYQLTLLVVHQKSGREGGYWREKEAAKTAELVAELQSADPDRNIAVLGDFNARADEPPLRTLTAAGLVDVFSDRVRDDPAWITHESGRAIDFVLVNPQLQRELIAGSRTIFGTPARPEGADWRTTPPPVGYASDHYPLVVDLTPRDQ